MKKDKSKEHKPSKKKKQSKTRRAANNVIMFCLICICAVSLYNIGKIIYSYRADQHAYKEIAKVAKADEFDGNIDFDALRETNPDIVAWIYNEDLKMNLPIVQGRDNDKYLKTLFDGTYGAAGTLFVDARIASPFKASCTIVYGHHMRDGSMLASLKKYTAPEFAKEHKRFELITPDGKYHLNVKAFLNIKAKDSVYMTPEMSGKTRAAYAQEINNKANYLIDGGVSEGDTLVALSTCAYEFDKARYVLVGRLEPWEEKEK